MIPRSEITSRVIDVVVQITLTDKDQVTEDSQLYEDLGVESIDFIDIIFNCETEFGIEIPNETVFTDREFFNPENGNWKDGKFTEKGWEELKRFPYLNQKKLNGPDPKAYLYSLGMLVDYIEYRLANEDAGK